MILDCIFYYFEKGIGMWRKLAEWMAALVRSSGLRRNRVGIESSEASVDRVLKAAHKRARGSYCTVVTSSANGPRARVVWPFKPTNDRVIHFATSAGSSKLAEIEANHAVVLVYLSGVTAYCQADVLTDLADRRRWWNPFFKAYWPQGPASDDYVVVRCRPYAFEVFSPRDGVGPAPHGLTCARVDLVDGVWRLAPPHSATA